MIGMVNPNTIIDRLNNGEMIRAETDDHRNVLSVAMVRTFELTKQFDMINIEAAQEFIMPRIQSGELEIIKEWQPMVGHWFKYLTLKK